MKFCQFLFILNCYIGQEKSQLDFMYVLFQKIMAEPYTTADIERNEIDEYYPFGKKSEDSLSRKVYSGERPLPKNIARFVKSHFDKGILVDEIDELDDCVRENLCEDFKRYGVKCDIDTISEVVSSLFLRFIEAAIREQDTIETGCNASIQIRAESNEATNMDSLLLLEVNNTCPICGAKLMYMNIKGQNVKRYQITQIFPEDINRDAYLKFIAKSDVKGKYNSMENLIALCANCAIDYLSAPTLEEFSAITEIKKAISKNTEIQADLNDIYLEEQIKNIILAIVNATDISSFVDLRMEALKIEEKIDKSNMLLLNSIRSDVVQYYKYIEFLFADIDSRVTGAFDRIALEIRLAYQKMKDKGLTQNDIFDQLKSWIGDKVSVSLRNDRAINAIVSFFVQNCEVFDEISQ